MGVSMSRILDLITEAISRYNREGMRGIEWTFDHMTDAEKLAYDMHLVKVEHSLAWQPGTTESRFKAQVKAMAEGLR